MLAAAAVARVRDARACIGGGGGEGHEPRTGWPLGRSPRNSSASSSFYASLAASLHRHRWRCTKFFGRRNKSSDYYFWLATKIPEERLPFFILVRAARLSLFFFFFSPIAQTIRLLSASSDTRSFENLGDATFSLSFYEWLIQNFLLSNRLPRSRVISGYRNFGSSFALRNLFFSLAVLLSAKVHYHGIFLWQNYAPKLTTDCDLYKFWHSKIILSTLTKKKKKKGSRLPKKVTRRLKKLSNLIFFFFEISLSEI